VYHQVGRRIEDNRVVKEEKESRVDFSCGGTIQGKSRGLRVQYETSKLTLSLSVYIHSKMVVKNVHLGSNAFHPSVNILGHELSRSALISQAKLTSRY
jgi:hypothetical protein